MEGKESSPRQIRNVLPEFIAEIDKRRFAADSDTIIGIKTGLSDLDSLLSGLRRKQLVVIGGRPGMGKSALATQIGLHVALKQKLPVASFCMEMSSVHAATRLVTLLGGPEIGCLRSGRINANQYENLVAIADELRNVEIFIDETPALKAEQVCARVRAIHRKRGHVGLIIIDDLQSMAPHYADANSGKSYGSTLSSLRNLAQEVDAPVMVLTQLKSKPDKRKDKRPRLCDLPNRAILKCADVTAFLYRDEYYRPETNDRDTTEIIVARNRYGSTGLVRLKFNAERLRFNDLCNDF